MEFLDKLVIPLSPEHLLLLHYITILIFFLFVPFISMALCGTFLSHYYKRKSIEQNNKIYSLFAKDVIEIVTINKSMGLMLGIITLITSILIFIQIFHTADIAAINYFVGSLFLTGIGLILIYTYRYSLTFNELFDSLSQSVASEKESGKNIPEELEAFKAKSGSLSRKSGKSGFIFLLLGFWLFVAGVTVAYMPKEWGGDNVLSILMSVQVIIRLISFLLLAIAFTGGVLLFAFFSWEGGRKDLSFEYKEFVRKISVNLAAAGALLIPVFLLINLFNVPEGGLSYSVFTYSTIALLLVFLAYHYLYVMYKNSTAKYSGQLFFVLLFTILAFIIQDQMVIGNSSQMQTQILAASFEETMSKLTGQTNAPKISGEDIYKNICSACHSFDHKVVGPPYKQTLPKYNGNVDKLVTFILNPTQNNPGYPPMPNPGLKPDQARAVAEYIIKEVKKYQ